MPLPPRFDKAHPLHELHVPRRKRVDIDEGPYSDAMAGGPDTDEDLLEKYRTEYRGEIVDEAELQ